MNTDQEQARAEELAGKRMCRNCGRNMDNMDADWKGPVCRACYAAMHEAHLNLRSGA